MTLLAKGTAGAHERGGIGFENVRRRVEGFGLRSVSKWMGRFWGGNSGARNAAEMVWNLDPSD